MAQPLPSGRKTAGKPSRGQQVMHHMFNSMDDDSNSSYDQRGSTSPAAARGLAADERLAMVDFSSAHESRPNNLVSLMSAYLSTCRVF
jgi:hypothetical protein